MYMCIRIVIYIVIYIVDDKTKSDGDSMEVES